MADSARLESLLRERILVLDGAMGTMIQRHGLTEADYRGERFARAPEGPPGQQRHPGAHPPRRHRRHPRGLSRSGRRHHRDQHLHQHAGRPGRLRPRGDRARAEPRRRAPRPGGGRRLHRETPGPTALRRRVHRPDEPHPAPVARRRTTRASAPSTSTQLRAAYAEQVRGSATAASTCLLVETIFDTLNAKAALFAIEEVFEERGARLPRHDLGDHHRQAAAAPCRARRSTPSGRPSPTRVP